MLKQLSLIVMIAAFSLLGSSVQAQRQGHDSIDWARGVIVATGSYRIGLNDQGSPVDSESGSVISLNRARVEAYRKARERAVQEMVNLVKGIRLDADTRLEDLLERSDVFQTRIVGTISRKMKAREYPVNFSTSGCRAELPIRELLAAVPYTYPEDEFPVRLDNPIRTDYTSLIIDARGLPVVPMILPSVFSEDGLEIFGRTRVDIRYVNRHGIAAYAANEEEAMKYRIAGGHPYYTAAVKDMKGCPVIADRDVRKILSSGRTVEALKKCRVIFIIDKIRK